MTALMTALYRFAEENLTMKYLYNDKEYHDAHRCVEKQLERFRETLTPEQTSHLNILLDEQCTIFSTQVEAYFQAGFAMAMELNRPF